MSFYKKVFLVLSTFALMSCEPGLRGELKVFNDGNQELTLKYTHGMKGDTLTTIVAPNSQETIKVLGGIGSNKNFDCCPCEINSLEIKSPQGNIKKDPSNSENWSIPNKKKLKKFGGQDIKCEFHVVDSDL